MSETTDNVRPIDRARETVSEAVDKTKEAVGDRVGAARERFQDVKADVGERLREKSDHARVAAREKYDVTADQLRDGYATVQKSVDELADDVSDFVRDNPGKAVLIAAGTGFLLGLLFRRRND